MRLPRFRLKKRQKPVKDQSVVDMVQTELKSYIKQNDLQGIIRKIEHDKRKKEIWDGLSNTKRLRLLKYIVSKKEASNEKR